MIRLARSSAKRGPCHVRTAADAPVPTVLGGGVRTARGLAVGLTALGSLWLSPAMAAPALEGVLESTSPGAAIAPWQTVYLMSEGAADARVVGPLNRGAKVTIEPDKSTDQYWYVQVPGSPGGAWQGYVWKHFVKVQGEAKIAAPATQVADKDAKKGKPAKGEKPDKAEKADKKGGKDPLLAYDPELFEVAGEDDGPVVPRAKPALQAEPVPPPPSFNVAASPAAPAKPAPSPASAAVPAAAPAAEPAARLAEAELASPLRQIQGLREQIERELEAAPQAALTQNMDQLVVRLNEVLKVERSIVGFLESTGKMVEAHDKRIKELSTKVATLSTGKGGTERAGLSDEVAKLRKKLDDLSTTVSTTRQYAKRLDALEAKMKRQGDWPSVVGMRNPGGAIESDRAAVVVGASPKAVKSKKAPEQTELDVEFDRRADQLEDHLYNVKRQARQLQKQIDEDEVDIPHIDARQVERERKRERQVAEGVVEVLDAPKKTAIPPGGTVANMLVKLRELREQRRREREVAERKTRGLAPAPAGPPAQPKPTPPPSDAERAAVEESAEYEDSEPDAAPAPRKKTQEAARKLKEIEGLLSARL